MPTKKLLTGEFTPTLLRWNRQLNNRKMPWKGEKDPYKIWLSEVILQQTRVEQGLAYYHRFITIYPTITKLASAKDEAVFKLWEGLGYYSRCRNLLATARFIAFEKAGVFPTQYNDLLALKGVGTYTAAAIASFAFNLPYAVVDGNVYRVLARYFGLDLPIDTTEGKKYFSQLANQLLNTTMPGKYNQAVMDFGATVCKPALPACGTCPLNKSCKALAGGMVNSLPVKSKTIQRTKRWFYYFIFQHQQTTAIVLREQKDIWQGLHEFYLIESSKAITWNKRTINNWLQEQLGISEYELQFISSVQSQQLTHQQITGQFIHIRINNIPLTLQNLQWLKATQMQKLAFPRFITAYLEKQL